MAPQGPAYDVDWVWSNNSNVHVANHRDWFTTFTEFKTQTHSLMGPGMEVQGIGDVELEVKTQDSPRGGSESSHRKLVLHDVLFAPKFICNILGGPIVHDYDVDMGHGSRSGGLKDRRTGASAGLFDHNKLLKLWLVGQPKGQSSLDPDELYWINVRWPDNERSRWLTHKKSLGEQPGVDAPPCTAAEKEWLKREFGGEFTFLHMYGLSISKEEDREEGRRIARAFMWSDAIKG
ncbi:hypothetical protein L228DRAFT_247259 [Xylona heveae TC161]|uniref:Retrovirus-related Pol polyprotein from transposon TNT 1-94-like beta-barrel domain-containing protein n=1 Tax=Xylona heveae (strain CBS 132557 / TC161) TaxID=1328760 RepID=A0A165H196_XYLHT|nr:hypothetical protein L228DRAFT_247259 [Xylona heveae TC161]KZF22857.1 hypothetical protein L228DRAFT_247259 [Xylona heveae TC161]